MTLQEKKKEFQTYYDMSSFGAPELNNYEISLFLTQATREIVEDIYNNFEFTEYVKRGLGPLLKESELGLTEVNDYFSQILATEAQLPVDLQFILQENIKTENQCGNIEIKPEDLDSLNKTMENPFRRPNDKRILRTEISKDKVRLYSSNKITDYKIKYLKKHNPIILSDFTTDPDLLGTETIEGRNKPVDTELPSFLHDKIVKRAVVIAIKSFRENNLKTQIEV